MPRYHPLSLLFHAALPSFSFALSRKGGSCVCFTAGYRGAWSWHRIYPVLSVALAAHLVLVWLPKTSYKLKSLQKFCWSHMKSLCYHHCHKFDVGIFLSAVTKHFLLTNTQVPSLCVTYWPCLSFSLLSPHPTSCLLFSAFLLSFSFNFFNYNTSAKPLKWRCVSLPASRVGLRVWAGVCLQWLSCSSAWGAVRQNCWPSPLARSPALASLGTTWVCCIDGKFSKSWCTEIVSAAVSWKGRLVYSFIFLYLFFDKLPFFLAPCFFISEMRIFDKFIKGVPKDFSNLNSVVILFSLQSVGGWVIPLVCLLYVTFPRVACL